MYNACIVLRACIICVCICNTSKFIKIESEEEQEINANNLKTIELINRDNLSKIHLSVCYILSKYYTF